MILERPARRPAGRGAHRSFRPPLFSPAIRPGLDRVRRVLARLGHPEEDFAALIVGGTNGKGSVSALVESAVRTAGYRTGLFTSPHLVDVRERVRIAGRPIDRPTWRRVTGQVAARAAQDRASLTEFEAQTLAAFLAFSSARVDLAILEVGLGGRLDAVNAFPAPELCVIASIGMDHTEWLGPTLSHIYREKRGIARASTPLVQDLPRRFHGEAQRFAISSGVPSHTLGRAIRLGRVELDARRLCQRIRVKWAGGSVETTVPFWGPHQARNAALALVALRLLAQRGWSVSSAAIRRGMARARWPGRFDVVRRHPPVVLDGAHNPAAAKALARAWRMAPWGRKKATVIFSCLKDKDARGLVTALSGLAKRVIVTPVASDRARSAEDLAAQWRGVCPVEQAENFGEAWRRARTSPGAPVLVTGSLYVVGEAIHFLGRR